MAIGGAMADWNSIASGVYIPSAGWNLINLITVWSFNAIITVSVFYILKKFFGSGNDLFTTVQPAI